MTIMLHRKKQPRQEYRHMFISKEGQQSTDNLLFQSSVYMYNGEPFTEKKVSVLYKDSVRTAQYIHDSILLSSS
jgi:hypothetical protein